MMIIPLEYRQIKIQAGRRGVSFQAEGTACAEAPVWQHLAPMLLGHEWRRQRRQCDWREEARSGHVRPWSQGQKLGFPSDVPLRNFKQKSDTILFFLLVRISLVPGWRMDYSKTKYESAGQTKGHGGGPSELYWGWWLQRNGRFEKGFGWRSWQSLDVRSQGKRKAKIISQVLGQSNCYLW